MLSDQESIVWKETHSFYGYNRYGLSEFSLDGIDCIIQGLYLRDIDKLGSDGKHKTFRGAIRSFAYLHFNRVVFTFKATYNLMFSGYYPESVNLIRSLLEEFVRFKYIEKHGKTEDLYLALAGHTGIGGDKFKVKYKAQFDSVAPGLYVYYQTLCDVAHGAMASLMLKTDFKTLEADIGLVFHPERSTFATNYFAVILYAYLDHLVKIYPEIILKDDMEFNGRFKKVTEILATLFEQIKNDPTKKEWVTALEGLFI